MNLTYKNLIEEITRAGLHPLAENNVVSVESTGYELTLEFDTSAFTERIDDLEADVEEADKEAERLSGVAKRHSERADKAEELLREIRESGDTTKLIAEYKLRAETAEACARLRGRDKDKIERELTLLRKKKGVSAKCALHASELVRALEFLSTGKVTLRLQAEASALLNEIRTP